MKRTALTIALVSSLATTAPAFASAVAPVMATVPAEPSMVPAPVSAADVQMLFGETATSSNLQVASLSATEMQKTEGAILWIPLLARMGGGFVLGGGGVLGYHFVNGGRYYNIPWRQVGYYAAAGALGGAWTRYVKVKAW